MNKLVFDAQIIGLHSIDYEYLQNSVESYSNRLYRQLLANPNTSAIIQGFELNIDALDNTKLAVDTSSTTGLSGLITQNSMIIETSTGISNISLSDDTLGTINYVYAHYYTIKGSYDIATDTIYEGVKSAIDIFDYSLEYNRQIDKLEIVVMTASEYSLITSTGDYILLGSTIAQGSGQPLISIDTTDVIYTIIAIPPGRIEVSNLSDSFLLPQTMVDNSDSIDDAYYGTPIDIEDDLNRIRTEIRAVKGTVQWDDSSAGTLANFDPAPDKLHINGVSTGYGSNFTTIIYTSSGSYYAKVDSGKALVNGYVIPIYIGESAYIVLPDLIIEDHGYLNVPEIHSGIYALDSFTLNEFTNGAVIDTSTLIVRNSTSHTYDINIDYTYTTSTGVVYMNATTPDGLVYVSYQYSFNQYQSVDISNIGVFEVIEGNASYPPYPGDCSGIRLYSLLRQPYADPITSDLIDCRNYLHSVREVTDINVEDYTIAPYTLNKFTYYTSTGEIDTTFNQWTITSTGTSYSTTTTNGAYMVSSILCREDDEIYLRVTIPTSTGLCGVTVSYETSTGTNIFTDVPFTNIQEFENSSDNVLIFIVKGLSEGYHKIKIINTTIVGTLTIYGLTYGKLDLYYTKDNIFLSGNIIAKGSITSKNINFSSTSSIFATNNDILVTNNTYYDGAQKYIIADEASSYRQYNGTHVFQAAPIGITDAVITWTEVLRTQLSSNSAPVVSIGNATIKAWASTYSILQIGGMGSIKSVTSPAVDNDINLSNNTYNDGVWKYVITDEASTYRQYNGLHLFYTAPSGTANTTITFTERLRIANTGEVGIGVTPSISSSGMTALQIGGLGVFTTQTAPNAGNQIYMAYNAYEGLSKYIIADYASIYYQQYGNHVFKTANSGSVGGAISYSERVRIQNSNTAAAPTLCLAEDINTGIWHPGDDIIAISTAGVERLRINNTGKVGINQSNPAYWLDIYGGTLGATQNDTIIVSRQFAYTAGSDQLLSYTYRVNNGSGWDTSAWRIQRLVDSSYFAYIQFGSGVPSAGGENLILGCNNNECVRIQDTNTSSYPVITMKGDINTGIYHPAEDTIAISTNGTERLRIYDISSGTSNTRLTIYASNSASLHLNCSTSYILLGETTSDYWGGIRFNGSYDRLEFLINSGSTLYIQSDGKMGSYETYSYIISASYRTVRMDSSYIFGTDGSSIRFKTNVKNMEDCSWIYNLRPVNFEFKKRNPDTCFWTEESEGRKRYGLIAEEVEKVNEFFIQKDKDGIPDYVEYENFIAPIIKLLQDHKKEIDALKAEIQLLKQ